VRDGRTGRKSGVNGIIVDLGVSSILAITVSAFAAISTQRSGAMALMVVAGVSITMIFIIAFTRFLGLGYARQIFRAKADNIEDSRSIESIIMLALMSSAFNLSCIFILIGFGSLLFGMYTGIYAYQLSGSGILALSTLSAALLLIHGEKLEELRHQ
jgi:hypothetical protein